MKYVKQVLYVTSTKQSVEFFQWLGLIKESQSKKVNDVLSSTEEPYWLDLSLKGIDIGLHLGKEDNERNDCSEMVFECESIDQLLNSLSDKDNFKRSDVFAPCEGKKMITFFDGDSNRVSFEEYL